MGDDMEKLIRDYALYNVLIESAKHDIAYWQDISGKTKSIPIAFGNLSGRMFTDRLKDIQGELRKEGVWVRFEIVERNVVVHVSGKVKATHEFTRREIKEAMDEYFEGLEEWILNVRLPDVPLKMEERKRDMRSNYGEP